jgi:DNA helicase-2/ATP-dependent DNA helicase PcrA
MTRAEKRLILSWAKWRRRFGMGEPQRSIPSRFLREVPGPLLFNIGVEDDENIPQIDLTAERHQVRQSARKNLYTGKTYNSLDNISQFFGERGMNFPSAPPASAQAGSAAASRPPTGPGAPSSPQGASQPPRFNTPLPPRADASPGGPAKAAPPPKAGSRQGTVVVHPKYGTGTVVRREGEGLDAKLTVLFPGYGLKKLVERYAGLKKT